MKSWISLIIRISVCVMVVSQCMASLLDMLSQIPMHEKIARVDNVDIYFWELKERLDVELRKTGVDNLSLSDAVVQLLFQNVLKEKILDCFLIKGAVQENILTDGEKVESLYQKFVSKFDSEEKRKQYFLDRKLDEHAIRERIANRLKLSEFQKHFMSQYTASSEDIDFYIKNNPEIMDTHEKWNISQIFKYAKSLEEKESIKSEFIQLRQDIESGQKKFSEVAVEVSEGATAKNGGYLGWISSGRPIDPVIKNEIHKLDAGQLSNVFETEEGVHLIYLGNVLPEMTEEGLKNVVANIVLEQKKNDALQQFYQKMESSSAIEYFWPPKTRHDSAS